MRIIFLPVFLFILISSIVIPQNLVNAAQNNDPIVYIVKNGDTLSKIGKKYGVNVSDITQLNSLKDPNHISKGQVILIPRKEESSSLPIETVRTQPKRIKPEPSSIVFNAAEVNEKSFEEEYSAAKKPGKSLKNSEYKEIRKVEGGTIEPASFDENIAEEKKEKPNAGFLSGTITSWFVVDIESEVAADFGPIRGTSIDLQEALGADDDLTVPVINVWLAPFNNPWIVFQWEYMEFDISGRRAIDESLTFEGITFSANDTVEGKADIQRVSGWVEINPFQGDWGYLGLLVGGEYVNIEAKLTNDFNGTISGTLPTIIPGVGGSTISRVITLDDVSAREEVDAGTVSLGGQARFNINENLYVMSRIRAFSYEVSDIDFSFVDMQAQLNLELLQFLTFSGGYRALFIEAENDNARGELNMHGPFISGGLKF